MNEERTSKQFVGKGARSGTREARRGDSILDGNRKGGILNCTVANAPPE
jgi:hypothetical protein